MLNDSRNRDSVRPYPDASEQKPLTRNALSTTNGAEETCTRTSTVSLSRGLTSARCRFRRSHDKGRDHSRCSVQAWCHECSPRPSILRKLRPFPPFSKSARHSKRKVRVEEVTPERDQLFLRNSLLRNSNRRIRIHASIVRRATEIAYHGTDRDIQTVVRSLNKYFFPGGTVRRINQGLS